MKLWNKIIGAFLGLSMALGTGIALSVHKEPVQVNAEGTDTTEYSLISLTTDLEIGKSYIITNGISGTVKAMATTSNTNNRKSVDITVSDSKIVRGSSVMSFTLGGSTDAWTFATENYGGTAGYLNATSTTSSNYLKVTATDDNYNKFSISFSDSAAVITCTGKSSRNLLRYNSSTNNGQLFSCYTSGQDPVYLWKEATSSCTHNWVAGTVHAPTCTEEGYTEYECSLCGETKTDDIIAALGHNYVDYICTRCGAEEPHVVHAGTLEDPYTPEEAILLCDQAGSGVIVGTDQQYYVKGVFNTGTNVNTTYHQWYGTLSGTVFKISGATNDSGVTVEETNGAMDGKEVIVKGFIELYNNEYKIGYLPASASPTGEKFVPSIVYMTSEGVTAWCESFLSTVTCDATGATPPSKTAWSTMKTSFTALSDADKLALKTLSNEATARYDYIVAKYSSSEYEDFIGRNPAPLSSRSWMINPINEINVIPAIIIVSIAAITMIGVIITLKKKKVN